MLLVLAALATGGVVVLVIDSNTDVISAGDSVVIIC
jgi:hypothetical protein